ncbi:MAG: nucleotidyl transferase AbiEii/AbiGii toxin family protein [Pseudohongiellaceae bacterium]
MIDIIRQRLEQHRPVNENETRQIVKEILQELSLYGLWRAGFFEVAAFQGGTSLRILHGLPRFSEDLDFILKTPDEHFNWSSYCDTLRDQLTQFGLSTEIKPSGRLDRTVRAAMIKEDSIINQLDIALDSSPGRKIRIKLEIDVVPPEGSGFQYRYLDFPLDFEVCHQDLSSNFALKIHALLCRPWVKGRDWFDFAWYVRQRIHPNLPLLENALAQYGPWAGTAPPVDRAWLTAALRQRVDSIDWDDARTDVRRFLSSQELPGLDLWGTRFFTARIDTMEQYFDG